MIPKIPIIALLLALFLTGCETIETSKESPYFPEGVSPEQAYAILEIGKLPMVHEIEGVSSKGLASMTMQKAVHVAVPPGIRKIEANIYQAGYDATGHKEIFEILFEPGHHYLLQTYGRHRGSDWYFHWNVRDMTRGINVPFRPGEAAALAEAKPWAAPKPWAKQSDPEVPVAAEELVSEPAANHDLAVIQVAQLPYVRAIDGRSTDELKAMTIGREADIEIPAGTYEFELGLSDTVSDAEKFDRTFRVTVHGGGYYRLDAAYDPFDASTKYKYTLSEVFADKPSEIVPSEQFAPIVETEISIETVPIIETDLSIDVVAEHFSRQAVYLKPSADDPSIVDVTVTGSPDEATYEELLAAAIAEYEEEHGIKVSGVGEVSNIVIAGAAPDSDTSSEE